MCRSSAAKASGASRSSCRDDGHAPRGIQRVEARAMRLGQRRGPRDGLAQQGGERRIVRSLLRQEVGHTERARRRDPPVGAGRDDLVQQGHQQAALGLRPRRRAAHSPLQNRQKVPARQSACGGFTHGGGPRHSCQKIAFVYSHLRPLIRPRPTLPILRPLRHHDTILVISPSSTTYPQDCV